LPPFTFRVLGKDALGYSTYYESLGTAAYIIAGDATWVPKTVKRINSQLSGNLTFEETEVLFFPYMCAYESQITGQLSPWCGVFTENELRKYAYSQDLSYFYSVGPGSIGPAKVLFLPFLESLISLLEKGPGQIGIGRDGTNFEVPNLIMAFLNDNQIAEMTAAMGILTRRDCFLMTIYQLIIFTMWRISLLCVERLPLKSWIVSQNPKAPPSMRHTFESSSTMPFTPSRAAAMDPEAAVPCLNMLRLSAKS
jgi:hypothetical protein